MLSTPATVSTLLALLWCPEDHGDLTLAGGAVACATCGRRYPFTDGVLSFLDAVPLSEVDQREVASRDAEATWYDTMFPEYTNLVEVSAMVERLGQPDGTILDFGAGTGRVTTELVKAFDQPVIAVDYSIEQLRRLAPRCAGHAVLPVHADGRHLPIRDGAMAAATSAEVYEHFRADDRRRVLEELARVTRPGATLSISTLSYNLLYRLWKLKGNKGAREGEHLLGGNFYYVRQTVPEFRAELSATFDVEEISGIRNIPARTLAAGVGKVAGKARGDRFLGWMVRRGHRIDRAMERLPTSRLTGFFLVARCRRR